MGLKRFSRITSNLHYCDQEEARLEGYADRDSPSFDKMYKIRRVLEAAWNSFRNARTPTRELSIDELVRNQTPLVLLTGVTLVIKLLCWYSRTRL